MPKFVVSTTLGEPDWNNTTVLSSGDATAQVRELKERFDGETRCPGSHRLVQELIEADLVDQINLMVFPVILGTGKKAFEKTPDRRNLQAQGVEGRRRGRGSCSSTSGREAKGGPRGGRRGGRCGVDRRPGARAGRPGLGAADRGAPAEGPPDAVRAARRRRRRQRRAGARRGPRAVRDPRCPRRRVRRPGARGDRAPLRPAAGGQRGDAIVGGAEGAVADPGREAPGGRRSRSTAWSTTSTRGRRRRGRDRLGPRLVRAGRPGGVARGAGPRTRRLRAARREAARRLRAAAERERATSRSGCC